MSYETKNPPAAKELLDGADGWQYLDVRSTPEFEQGHPEGAYHVPLAEMGPGGQMQPNSQFVEVVKKSFPADARLVVGCAMGGRSQRACEMLTGAGFQNLVNMMGGFSGARDPGGRLIEKGWQECGYPVATAAQPQHSYPELRDQA